MGTKKANCRNRYIIMIKKISPEDKTFFILALSEAGVLVEIALVLTTLCLSSDNP